MKLKVLLSYLFLSIFCIYSYGQNALGKDEDYLSFYLTSLGGKYQTKVLNNNETMFIRHEYLINSDKVRETQYYFLKNGICEQIDIISPYDDKSWKSYIDYFNENNYKTTEFYYPEIVDENQTVKKSNVYYKPESKSELYPDKVNAAHYMTITKVEINDLPNMKISYFQNTSDFTK